MTANRSKSAYILASLATVAMFVLTLASCMQKPPPEGVPASRSHDGRFGTQCYLDVGGQEKPYCWTPMARLIANPERFHNARIGVVGFLIRHHDRIVLYPNRDSWYQGISNESIDIDIPADDPLLKRLQHLLKDGYAGILVIGEFNARMAEANGMRLGTMQNVEKMFVNVGGQGPEPVL